MFYLVLCYSLVYENFRPKTIQKIVLLCFILEIVLACSSSSLEQFLALTLGIEIELYGHVLGPLKFRQFSRKSFFFNPVFKPFFNGLIKNFQNVIKVRYGVRF